MPFSPLLTQGHILQDSLRRVFLVSQTPTASVKMHRGGRGKKQPSETGVLRSKWLERGLATLVTGGS